MSLSYRAISWNGFKKKYDLILWLFIAGYCLLFVGLQYAFFPNATLETTVIRCTSTLAFVLLNVILIIGPLTRLNRRFLPFLYNRRHLGVSFFIIVLVHGVFSLIQFHGGSDTPILVSLLTSNPNYLSLIHFPFQVLGATALLIFFLMAATSHDFWLETLSPGFWKRLHMLVYIAYGLVIMHVVLGFLQDEVDVYYVVAIAGSFITVSGLHLVSSARSIPPIERLERNGWIPAGDLASFEEGRAKRIRSDNNDIAVYLHQGKIYAVSNQCAHQMGPLSEGRIIDGCITCPWHGYQFDPESGCSPPPFTDQIAVFPSTLEDGEVWIKPEPAYAERNEK